MQVRPLGVWGTDPSVGRPQVSPSVSVHGVCRGGYCFRTLLHSSVRGVRGPREHRVDISSRNYRRLLSRFAFVPRHQADESATRHHIAVQPTKAASVLQSSMPPKSMLLSVSPLLRPSGISGMRVLTRRPEPRLRAHGERQCFEEHAVRRTVIGSSICAFPCAVLPYPSCLHLRPLSHCWWTCSRSTRVPTMQSEVA